MAINVDQTHRYTIMEAAKLSGLPESTLRYYETIGLIDPVSRDSSSKHRIYKDDDINLIVAIACLNATGLSLKDMRTYLGNRERGAEGAQEQISLLESQKQRLVKETRFIKLRQRYVETKISYWQAIEAGDDLEAESISRSAKLIAAELKLPIEN